jgi:hypothetical protein
MASTLQELMKELGFEPLATGTPAMYRLELGTIEIYVGQLSDGEIHVTKTGSDRVALVVRFNRYDEALGALVRQWLLVPVR